MKVCIIILIYFYLFTLNFKLFKLTNDVEKCFEMTGVDAVMSAEGILSNPLLFSGYNLCSFYVAHEYLNFAEKFKASVSAIRAHLFKICHYRFFLILLI